MKPELSYASVLALLFVGLSLGVASVGCKAQQTTAQGNKIGILLDQPTGCENLGVVIGHAGGMTGAYSKPSVLRRSAKNDAKNLAAARGATHILMHPEELAQGDGQEPDYQDTEPAMAHGYGTGSTVTIAATAYKCALDAPAAETAMSIKGAGTFVEVKAPTSISMAPLGTLKSITVYRRSPMPSGTGMSESETLVVVDAEQIDAVVQSLSKVAEDPIKYIPTHRVEFVGELGVQSLLYGFGYLQYAETVYRLTDGAFEAVLVLREEPAGPEVVEESPAEAEPATPEAEPATAE